MKSVMIKHSLKQKGFGVISLIILLALIFAVLNAYAYYNPAFSLAKYSPLNYFRLKLDEERAKDLGLLEKAISAYYEEHNVLPASDDWCGRISGVLHPEFGLAIQGYFPNNDFPNDPAHGNSNKDYFYYRVDRSHYVLMAVFDIPKKDPSVQYNFSGCHDWPGDDIYNYQVSNLNTN